MLTAEWRKAIEGYLAHERPVGSGRRRPRPAGSISSTSPAG